MIRIYARYDICDTTRYTGLFDLRLLRELPLDLASAPRQRYIPHILKHSRRVNDDGDELKEILPMMLTVTFISILFDIDTDFDWIIIRLPPPSNVKFDDYDINTFSF